MIALDRLQQIIPPDQALANKALGASLKQIAGITNTNLPTLAVVTSNIETTKDLPIITALTQAVPPAVANYYTSTLAAGGGVNGEVRVVDVIGLAAGWVATDAFVRTVEIFSTMNLSYLISIFQVITNSYNGDYGNTEAGPLTIPPGLPGAGTYYGTLIPPDPPETVGTYNPSALQAAMAVVVPLISPAITSLQSTYPTETSELNTLFNSMAQQVATEQSLQTIVKLDYSQLTANDRNSIYGFIFNLSTYGAETEQGGVVWFIEAMADLTTQAGQAIVACLRQGRNQDLLSRAGITSNTKIPDQPEPPPPEAVLIPSEYSESEATELVIK